ncbi:processive 1,2-diacylglycerol beta-glucosyltransferase [Deinobacterium chartae]|uniref:Processive 1,2-diacylglycerol beta-glucosyltransferase n=1 Tax=Deinobacterium chartae TaxID=521158 RepID=A0A841I5I4_9DEIO|nr:processive 1,2-diacylglycerol beta-glucosyltransferase [Deinobacterium chartae]
MDELRVLLLSASLGGGHTKANQALAQLLEAQRPGASVSYSDYLAYLHPLQRAVVEVPYTAWLRYYPAGYRYFYNWTNRPGEPKAITAPFGWAGLPAMRRDLERVRPQIVISSYTAPVALADAARKRYGYRFLNAMIVTDYEAHRHWARPEADLIMVATEAVRQQIAANGVDPSRIQVTGIPIDPRYTDLPSREALRERLGFEPERPVIMLSAGATGAYRSHAAVMETLGRLAIPTRVLVTGVRGGPSVEQVGRVTVHRYGYTDAFPELLGASDLVVGKAGGLTVSEACALGVPMLIYDPIPGQEEGNARYLEAAGAARWARDLLELRTLLTDLLIDVPRRARMGAAARAIGKPHAARDVARTVLEHYGKVEKLETHV